MPPTFQIRNRSRGNEEMDGIVVPKSSQQESCSAPLTTDQYEGGDNSHNRLTSHLLHLCDAETEEAFQSVRDLSDSEMDDEVRRASVNISPTTDVPEAYDDCPAIGELILKIKAGLIVVPRRIDSESLRTKMKFRDLDGWLAEIGTVPAPVAAVGGNPVGIRLSEKVLEQNHRLLLQVTKRAKPISAASFALHDDGLDGDVHEDGRRGSHTSQGNKVTDDVGPDFVMDSFYKELEDEERRLSTLDGTLSDDDEN